MQKLYESTRSRASIKLYLLAGMQINDLAVWWKYIAKEIDNEMAWLSLNAFEDIIEKDNRIPVDKLGFLWPDSEATARLLVELSIAQSQYEHARAAMNERSRFHRDVVQPTIARIAAVRNSEAGLIGFDLSQVPWDLVEKAQRNTSNLFEHVAKTLVNHERLVQHLVKTAKERFQDSRFNYVNAPQDVADGVKEYLQKLKQ